ncbi:MAG: (2Fe-2S)-binding protein [Candidatus Hadarchaeales archaeon]
MEVICKINGEKKILSFEPHERLLDVLRRNGYKSVKKGCETGHCGSCVVLVDGRPVKSCMMFAAQAMGKEITTVEALGTISNPHPIQKAFVEAGAVQCGFCTPTMILCTKALLDEIPNPTEEEIKKALDGVLCRCTGYVKIIKAVKIAAEKMGGGRSEV